MLYRVVVFRKDGERSLGPVISAPDSFSVKSLAKSYRRQPVLCL